MYLRHRRVSREPRSVVVGGLVRRSTVRAVADVRGRHDPSREPHVLRVGGLCVRGARAAAAASGPAHDGRPHLSPDALVAAVADAGLGLRGEARGRASRRLDAADGAQRVSTRGRRQAPSRARCVRRAGSRSLRARADRVAQAPRGSRRGDAAAARRGEGSRVVRRADGRHRQSRSPQSAIDGDDGRGGARGSGSRHAAPHGRAHQGGGRARCEPDLRAARLHRRAHRYGHRGDAARGRSAYLGSGRSRRAPARVSNAHADARAGRRWRVCRRRSARRAGRGQPGVKRDRVRRSGAADHDHHARWRAARAPRPQRGSADVHGRASVRADDPRLGERRQGAQRGPRALHRARDRARTAGRRVWCRRPRAARRSRSRSRRAKERRRRSGS